MKNPNLFLTIFLFFVFFSIDSIAQVRVGIKSGINISDIHNEENGIDVISDVFTPASSFHIGAYSDIFLSKKFSLLLEVLYSVKGTQAKFDFSLLSGTSPFNLTSRLKYLSIPILFNYHFKNISFEIGPEFSYQASSKTTVNNEKPVVEFWGGSKFDIGIDFGLKYQLKKWNLGVRFSRGFIDISNWIFTDFNGNIIDDPNKLLNRVVQVSLGFDLLQKNSSKTEDE